MIISLRPTYYHRRISTGESMRTGSLLNDYPGKLYQFYNFSR